MVALALPPRADTDHEYARRARAGLLPFVRQTFPAYQTADFHRTIVAHLEAIECGDIDRLIITMPPRHGKSELASIHFPAWYLGRNPGKRVIATSYGAGLAYRFSRRARNLIAAPAWPFPDVALSDDLATVQSWDIAGHRGGYLAAGVGGPITGSGADLLIVDDPIKSADEADSETYREATWQWWQDTAYPRMQAGASAVVIGTRWHDDDLIGRLLAAAETGGDVWTVLHLPAVNAWGEALWPDVFDLEKLERIKANMSSRMWQAQFQGDPQPAEGGMFKPHWWSRYSSVPPLRRVELFIDSAFKEGVQNDYSVIATWGDTGDGDYYVLDVWRDRVAFPELLRAAHDQWAKQRATWSARSVVIEDKASGQSAIQVLQRTYHTATGALPALPVVAWSVTGAQSKVARAEGVTGFVESGRVHLPEFAPWVADFVDEHARFPIGVHDDQVDTTSMGLTRFAVRAPSFARSY